MIRVGLTGNIGSGKSLIADILEKTGIPVLRADDEAKKILYSQPVMKILTKHFGKNILTENGRIDTRALASIVFNNKEELRFLNQIIHPALKENINKWFAGQQPNTPFAVVEAAILFENSFEDLFDHILLVTADEKTRLTRVMKRDNATAEEVKSRMKNQWDERLKIEKSDYIIRNDGSQMLLPQIIRWKEYMEKHATK